MWNTSSGPTRWASIIARVPAMRVLCVCTTPLGSPVVPDVKMSPAAVSSSTRRRVTVVSNTMGFLLAS